VVAVPGRRPRRVVGAYACVKLKSGGKLARFLPKSDIEKIRNSAKSKDSPAWRNWWEEMARKCALKRTLKDAPLSTEKYVKAMEHEEPTSAWPTWWRPSKLSPAKRRELYDAIREHRLDLSGRINRG
jgi:recombinational DNA repair protein RecT